MNIKVTSSVKVGYSGLKKDNPKGTQTKQETK
jgi:hypothetical protein